MKRASVGPSKNSDEKEKEKNNNTGNLKSFLITRIHKERKENITVNCNAFRVTCKHRNAMILGFSFFPRREITKLQKSFNLLPL